MNEIIYIENEKNISIKGAKKVVSSTPSQTVAQTELSIIIFSGSEMEVKKLDIENQEVVLSGNITNIKFSKKVEKQPFLKRIFK